ncbi:MAG: DUF4412 domain-containing protein [Ginsengibacter sp.]
MKKIIFLFISALAFQKVPAQFIGVLHYENGYVDKWFGTKGKVLTTIYESGSMIRIEAKDTSFTKKDVTQQNTLLVDIGKGTETHLQEMYKRGIVYSISDKEKQAQMMNDQAHTIFNFENLGQEKIGQFNCTHFLITKSYANLKKLPPARFDIWITKDLGSCNVWYVGNYLYFFGGMELYKKLAGAGADGVVIKWQETTATTTTCTLTGYEKETLASSTFTTPSNYAMTNAPNFPLKK